MKPNLNEQVAGLREMITRRKRAFIRGPANVKQGARIHADVDLLTAVLAHLEALTTRARPLPEVDAEWREKVAQLVQEFPKGEVLFHLGGDDNGRLSVGGKGEGKLNWEVGRLASELLGNRETILQLLYCAPAKGDEISREAAA